MNICIAQPLFDVFSCNTSVKEKPLMLSSPIIRIPHVGTLLLAKGKPPSPQWPWGYFQKKYALGCIAYFPKPLPYL